MKKPPLILHVINNLSLGGAELLLNNTIELLPQFQHLVVYLHQSGDLRQSFRKKGTPVICLDYRGWKSIPSTILKLRALIKKRKPVLVHSHLFYSTFFTRLAIPASVPLISTIHSLYSKDAFHNSFKSVWAARLTLKERHTLIGVSQVVLHDYLSHVPFKGRRFVLHNFLPDSLFQNLSHCPPRGTIKLIAVGNLKEAKNYLYLLQVFKYLSGVSLDIYGTGPQEEELAAYIQKEKLNVRLCGSTNNIPGIFHQYDFFIQASSHEGFGLSVIEAMAAGIPVILSDIPVFREITNELASFFPLDKPGKAAQILTELFAGEYPERLSREAFDFVSETYSAKRYLQKLVSIYEEVTQKKLSFESELIADP